MNSNRSATLAGVALALMLMPTTVVAGTSVPASATTGTVQLASSPTTAARVNVWQARKRHALHLDRAHRAVYVRRLAAHMRPCPMEDSRNCVWNGHTAGNHVGRSFIDLTGVAFYFNGQVSR